MATNVHMMQMQDLKFLLTATSTSVFYDDCSKRALLLLLVFSITC